MKKVKIEKSKEKVRKIVLKKSKEVNGLIVKGHGFDKNLSLKEFVKAYKRVGFQATKLARAIEIIKAMQKEKAKIFFGYTSNIVSSGLRDIIAWLVKNKKVHVLVTTGGGIEEDIIKLLKPFYLQDESNVAGLNDKDLRGEGINRIYNILVPNSNYVAFEKFMMPFFDWIYENYIARDKVIAVSEFINALGFWLEKNKIKNRKQSIVYWAYKNKIPIFCPTLTDGSMGDMLYFYSLYRKKKINIDIVADTIKINEIAIKAKKTGIISLGTGVISHYMLNANLFRNGSDYAVYITTARPEDGSAAGASPSEAVSWGKIKGNKVKNKRKENYVKVWGDASIIFPLIVAGAFL